MKKNMEQLTQSYRIDQGEVIKASKGAWFSNTIQELKRSICSSDKEPISYKGNDNNNKFQVFDQAGYSLITVSSLQ